MMVVWAGCRNGLSKANLAYFFLCGCVYVCELCECGKARCSTARSPNRAETQTTYRSNEGGNEKVIFTNFS